MHNPNSLPFFLEQFDQAKKLAAVLDYTYTTDVDMLDAIGKVLEMMEKYKAKNGVDNQTYKAFVLIKNCLLTSLLLEEKLEQANYTASYYKSLHDFLANHNYHLQDELNKRMTIEEIAQRKEYRQLLEREVTKYKTIVQDK